MKKLSASSNLAAFGGLQNLQDVVHRDVTLQVVFAECLKLQKEKQSSQVRGWHSRTVAFMLHRHRFDSHFSQLSQSGKIIAGL